MHANWTSECGCLIVNMAHDARLLRCQLGDGLVVVASRGCPCRRCFYLQGISYVLFPALILSVSPSPHPKC